MSALFFAASQHDTERHSNFFHLLFLTVCELWWVPPVLLLMVFANKVLLPAVKRFLNGY